MARFHYSGYWGTWSRVISVGEHGIIELNLTPIPHCASSTWDNHVKPEVFRHHYTAFGRGDKDTNALPLEVCTQLIMNLGMDLTDRLLNHDYLSEVKIADIITACKNAGIDLGTIKAKALP